MLQQGRIDLVGPRQLLPRQLPETLKILFAEGDGARTGFLTDLVELSIEAMVAEIGRVDR